MDLRRLPGDGAAVDVAGRRQLSAASGRAGPGVRRRVVTGSRSKLVFARHFAEMVVAMLLGMGVLGGLASLMFSLTGGRLMDEPGAVRVMLMGLSMTVPMVLWMRYRGHPTGRSVEMAASMLVPSALAAALAAVGLLGAGSALGLQHAVMVPAMLGAMLWRYDEYARPHAGSTLVGRRSARPEAPSAGPEDEVARPRREPVA